jgi:hypothetical protein
MRYARLTFLLAILPSFNLPFGGGAAIPKIPVVGKLAGQRIRTTVDSELAKYYLESYLPNKRTRPQLDSLIDQIHHATSNASLPTREYLEHLSHMFSVDFAALYLAKQILEDKANQPMQEAYH